MLAIEHVTKTYGNKTILNDVSLQIKRGQIAVLLGASGVGKSTLLRILNNLETVDRGSFSLDGTPLDVSTVNQTHTVGFLFQNFNLFEHLTVLENITLPLEKALGKSPQEAHEIALQLLDHYQLADKGNMYPADLSGGQKQRVALARTLALKPQILCLDEPTSALDPLLTSHIAGIIQDLANQGYIVLVATHDTSLIERLDCTIYLMKGGSIIETASSAQLKSNESQFPHIATFIAGKL